MNTKKIQKSFEIDFVVSWVDGSDESWRQKKNKRKSMFETSEDKSDVATSDIRYRESGLFKYWFRAVEKYAPWVRNIYLVTDNQVPAFLDLAKTNVILIDHKDIIDSEYLPTFNSSTIELNLFKINGLSDHFVYFNDDVYLNRKVSKSDFFDEFGNAKDTIGQYVIMPTEIYDHNVANNTAFLNNNYNKKNIIKTNSKYFFDIRQGYKVFLLNIILSIFPMFTGLYDPHTSISIVKKDMLQFYEMDMQELKDAFSSPFRSKDDLTIQAVRYLQIANHHERPRYYRFGRATNTHDPVSVNKLLFDGKTKVVNVNDSEKASTADLNKILESFENKFPIKSSNEI